MKVNGEILIERTIRLLKENGITDIAISTNNPAFDYLDIEKLRHKNDYSHDDEERNKKSEKSWLNAYYPIEEPVCYIPGDIYFSEYAIKRIVETKVKDTMFFCIRDICDGRPVGINIKGREPLAYKVENQKVFRKAIDDLLQMIDEGKFKADPIAWNLYRKINELEIAYDWSGNDIFNTKGDYMVIDDYSTDIDTLEDIQKIEQLIKIMKGGIKMVKVKVIENFYLGRFHEIQNLVRNSGGNEPGFLYVNDIFECTEDLAEYLTKTNSKQRAFVEVIEVIPEKQEEKIVEEKPKRRTRKKVNTEK